MFIHTEGTGDRLIGDNAFLAKGKKERVGANFLSSLLYDPRGARIVIGIEGVFQGINRPLLTATDNGL